MAFKNWKLLSLAALLVANVACVLVWSGSFARAESPADDADSPGKSPQNQPEPERDSFVSRDLGCSFTLPILGKPAEGESVSPAFVFAGAKRDGIQPNINLTVEQRKIRRDDYADESKKNFEKMGWQLISMENAICSGRDCLRIEFNGRYMNMKLHWLALAVIEPERVLLMTCTAPEKSFEELRTEFRTCLDSFALLESSTSDDAKDVVPEEVPGADPEQK